MEGIASVRDVIYRLGFEVQKHAGGLVLWARGYTAFARSRPLLQREMLWMQCSMLLVKPAVPLRPGFASLA
eukprot:587928-Amphidinium_carterae.1